MDLPNRYTLREQLGPTASKLEALLQPCRGVDEEIAVTLGLYYYAQLPTGAYLAERGAGEHIGRVVIAPRYTADVSQAYQLVCLLWPNHELWQSTKPGAVTELRTQSGLYAASASNMAMGLTACVLRGLENEFEALLREQA